MAAGANVKPSWHALEPPAPLTLESLLTVLGIYERLPGNENEEPAPALWVGSTDADWDSEITAELAWATVCRHDLGLARWPLGRGRTVWGGVRGV